MMSVMVDRAGPARRGLNAWLGWWWADPLGAFIMVPLIAREGWAALRGDAC